MKVLKKLNNISEDLKKTIPEFGPGKVAEFKLVKGGNLIRISSSPNGQPGNEESKTVESFGSSRVIVLKDRIYDPFKKEYVDIGVPDEDDGERMIRPKKHKITSVGDNIFLNGFFTLSGDNVEDVETFEFLWLSNKREDNANRAKGVEPEYKYVDKKVEAKKKEGRLKNKALALAAADNLTAEERRYFAGSLNWNLHDEDLYANILEYADKNPDDFVKRIQDKSAREKFIVKEAIDLGVIAYDPAQHRIVWGGGNQTVALLEREEGKTPVELFYEWTQKAKNGMDVYKGIRKKVMTHKGEPELTEQ